MASFVADASVLIALARIGRLSLLRDLTGEVVVPPSVALEVQGTLPQLPDWIRVQSPLRGVESHAPWPRALAVGEIEAIALAIDLDAELVILDDLPARRLAIDRGLPVVGTAGLVVAAKRRGLIPSVRPDLDALRESGFRLRQDVYLEILRAAGELPVD